MDHTPQVDADHPLEVTRRELPDGSRNGQVDPGVVAQEVDAAEGVERSCGESIDLVGDGYVRGDGQRRRTSIRELLLADRES